MPQSDQQASVTREQLAELTRFDTPTICNGLEIVVPARRGLGYTVENLVCANPALPPIVGFARTVTIRAVQPTSVPADQMRLKRVDYYRYNRQGPPALDRGDPGPRSQSRLWRVLGRGAEQRA